MFEKPMTNLTTTWRYFLQCNMIQRITEEILVSEQSVFSILKNMFGTLLVRNTSFTISALADSPKIHKIISDAPPPGPANIGIVYQSHVLYPLVPPDAAQNIMALFWCTLTWHLVTHLRLVVMWPRKTNQEGL